MSSQQRISTGRELRLLLSEAVSILFGQTRNLIISLLFPLGAALITIWIAGENMFVSLEDTKSALFIIVCAAIWGGLFNSIQVVVKERDNIKRDYVSGAMRLGCYTASRAIVQLLLCAFQAAVLCISFIGVEKIHDHSMPGSGLIFGSALLEYYISIFLLMYAADCLGLMISCIVKSEQLASQLSPYILIVQLLFSGVLFTMEGGASTVSGLMISRWGMAALGSTTDLNECPNRLQLQGYLQFETPVNDDFAGDPEHLVAVWLILVAFCVVPLILGNLSLRSVKKDSR